MSARFELEACDGVAVEGLRDALGVSRALASILVRRGLGEPAAARAFLAADERHDPSTFGGVEPACALVLEHVAAGSRIAVHGDYDVDGVCSTAIVLGVLRELGADPDWHLPSRDDDGYGLSSATVERLAERGTRLIITVDCGITARAEVARARELGVDVLVTDHHRPPDELPDCPVLHPALGAYPCPDLCATGVAHMLSRALRERAGSDPAAADAELDLVGLATIGDLVPLRGENRRLARAGVAALRATRRPGLRALARVAGVELARIDARAVSFALCPRINAAGRMARADAALELVTTTDEERAEAVARELDALNRERQAVEQRILFEAESQAATQLEHAAIVVAGEGWRHGVVGIVASRLVERHCRPVVAVAVEGGRGKGSGRSIDGYDLLAGLAGAGDHLERFGGHRAAAGLEIDPARIDDFRAAFRSHAGEALAGRELVPRERLDAVVGPGGLGRPLAEEIAQLEPFGLGNPQPRLLVPAARIEAAAAMGAEERHARFTLAGGGSRARGVAFRRAASSMTELAEEPQDLSVTLELNEWRGTIEPRAVLRAIEPVQAGPVEVLDERDGFFAALGREFAAPLGGAGDGMEIGTARAVADRRSEGFAAVVAELVATGEPVAVLCADARRRRPALELLAGGIAARLGAPAPAALSWDSLAVDATAASSCAHVVVLDPPLVEDAIGAVARVAGRGTAHVCWGEAEVAYSLAAARAGLELRPALGDVWRGLRAAGGEAAGEELERILRGTGGVGRSAIVCGRIVRVVLELGAAAYEAGAAEPTLRLIDTGRLDLFDSPAYRAYTQRLEAAERALAPAAEAAEAA